MSFRSSDFSGLSSIPGIANPRMHAPSNPKIPLKVMTVIACPNLQFESCLASGHIWHWSLQTSAALQRWQQVPKRVSMSVGYHVGHLPNLAKKTSNTHEHANGWWINSARSVGLIFATRNSLTPWLFICSSWLCTFPSKPFSWSVDWPSSCKAQIDKGEHV